MKRDIINTIFAICILIVCFLFLVGCRTAVPNKKIEKKTIIQRDTTIVFDTLVKIRPDSSLLMLYAKCDSNNNLLLSELMQVQGDRSKIKYKYIDNYIDNIIYIDCLCDSLEVEIEDQKTINKYITEQYFEQQKMIVEKDSFIKKLGLICIGMLMMLIVMLILIHKRKKWN